MLYILYLLLIHYFMSSNSCTILCNSFSTLKKNKYIYRQIIIRNYTMGKQVDFTNDIRKIHVF